MLREAGTTGVDGFSFNGVRERGSAGNEDGVRASGAVPEPVEFSGTALALLKWAAARVEGLSSL